MGHRCATGLVMFAAHFSVPKARPGSRHCTSHSVVQRLTRKHIFAGLLNADSNSDASINYIVISNKIHLQKKPQLPMGSAILQKSMTIVQ